MRVDRLVVTVIFCWQVLLYPVWAETVEKDFEFEGKVITAEGVTIEGAELELFRVSASPSTLSYSVISVGKTSSDAEGKFSFSTKFEQEQGYSSYCCLAKKKGHSCGWATLTGQNNATLEITLGKPAKIMGFVQNIDGSGIEGAEVRMIFLSIPGGDNNFMVGFEPIDDFVTKTCSEGRFEFNNIPEGATCEFLITKSGKGTVHSMNQNMSPSQGLTYKAGQTDITFTLVDGCELSGVVVSKESQKPVSGISVAVMDTNLPINICHKPVITNEDGEFEFSDLLSGQYSVSVQSEEWPMQPLQVEVPNEKETKIELSKGGVIKVTVVEADTKEPVSDAHVSFRSNDTDQHQQGSTDESGVTTKQLAPGTYQVRAYKQGYNYQQQSSTVVVQGDKTEELTFELKGMPKISGTVVDAKGKAVEGAWVRLIPSSGSSRNKIVTDENGKFKMTWDPAEMEWTEGECYVYASLAQGNLAGIELISDEAKDITVKLVKGITAKGKVRNEAGEPIAAAKMSLMFRGSNYSTSFGMEADTDEEGVYEFGPLVAERRYTVHVAKAEGYGQDQQAVEILDEKSEIEVNDIVLQVADQKVTGQVVDVDGKGLANVQVYCYGNGQPSIHTKTDDEGKFVLEPVCSGEIRINSHYNINQEYLHGSVRTEGGAEDVKIILSSQNNDLFVPKKAISLVGKQLSDMSEYGIDIPLDAKAVLLFFWDMNQRPSRHFVKELWGKAELLKNKSVSVVLVNETNVDKNKLDSWLEKNGIQFESIILGENSKKIKEKMGVQGLPWIILTDAERKVIAEGISVNELESTLSSDIMADSEQEQPKMEL